MQRKLGPKRQTGQRDGLTKSLAEAKLRELMNEGVVVATERTTLKELGDAYINHLEFVMAVLLPLLFSSTTTASGDPRSIVSQMPRNPSRRTELTNTHQR